MQYSDLFSVANVSTIVDDFDILIACTVESHSVRNVCHFMQPNHYYYCAVLWHCWLNVGDLWRPCSSNLQRFCCKPLWLNKTQECICSRSFYITAFLQRVTLALAICAALIMLMCCISLGITCFVYNVVFVHICMVWTAAFIETTRSCIFRVNVKQPVLKDFMCTYRWTLFLVLASCIGVVIRFRYYLMISM